MQFKRLILLATAIFAAILGIALSFRNRPITLKELERRNIVGDLGLPLGTPVEIDAELVSGSSLGSKLFDSLYLLQVTHVNDKELTPPPLMQFFTPAFASVELANDTFALYAMKHGEQPMVLDAMQIAELEKDYVGKKVRLVVYEVGSFDGIPTHLPRDVPIWADAGFRFSTSLIILKEHDARLKHGRTKHSTEAADGAFSQWPITYGGSVNVGVMAKKQILFFANARRS